MPESPPLLESTRRALDHRLAVGQTSGRAPSIVAGLVRDGELAWTGGCGSVDGQPPTADTQYRIGSITKTFVAVLVMRLRDEGALALDDRLDRHLPETAELPGVGSARVGELLAHTTGLASETAPPWWERVLGDVRPELSDLFEGDGRRLPAGRHFHYSNPGFGLLGALVGRLRGTSWDSAVRAEILEPLGMSRTTTMPTTPSALGWAVHPWADLVLPEPTPDAGLMAPAGQLWSTTADLSKFAGLLLGAAPDILCAPTLAEMRTPASPPGSTESGPSWESGFGLGVQMARVGGRTLSGHSGSMPGFVAMLWTSPADRLAAVCLANATAGPQPGLIAADLIATVAEREPVVPTAWQPMRAGAEPDPDVMALLGPWYWGATALALRLRGDGDLELISLGAAGRTSRFHPLPDGTWRGLDGYYHGEILHAVRRTDGGSHLDVGGFVLTRAPYPQGPDGDAVPGGVDPGGWRGQ